MVGQRLIFLAFTELHTACTKFFFFSYHSKILPYLKATQYTTLHLNQHKIHLGSSFKFVSTAQKDHPLCHRRDQGHLRKERRRREQHLSDATAPHRVLLHGTKLLFCQSCLEISGTSTKQTTGRNHISPHCPPPSHTSIPPAPDPSFYDLD